MTTPKPFSDHSALLTPQQADIIASAARGARLADQHQDRQRLRDALPELIMCIDLESNPNDPIKPDALEATLSRVWPPGTCIGELDEFKIHPDFDGIEVLEIESEGFTRDPTINENFVSFSMGRSDEETFDAHSDMRYIRDDLYILSKKVVIQINTENEDYCDDEYDVSMDACVFVSNCPQQMQSLIRQECKESKYDGMTQKLLEEKLQFIFGSQYVKPKRPAAKAKP